MPAVRYTAAENKWKQRLSSTTDPAAVSTALGIGGTDIAASVDLGSTRVLHLLGDTFMFTAVGQTRLQAFANTVRNAVALQTGSYDLGAATLTEFTGGSPTAPTPYFPFRQDPRFGQISRYPMCGIKLDDRVLVIGMEYQTLGLGERIGPWAMMAYNIAGNPDTWRWEEVFIDRPHRGIGKQSDFAFGNGIVDPGDGYLYIWVQGAQADTGWYVCRCSRETVKNARQLVPEFWDGGARWVKDSPARAHRVNVLPPGVLADQPGAVYRRPSGNYQVFIIPEAWLDADHDVAYAEITKPDAKFPPFTELYDVPTVDAADFSYHALPHPEQTWAGKGANDILVSYSRNRNAGSVTTDATAYWPEYLQVTGV